MVLVKYIIYFKKNSTCMRSSEEEEEKNSNPDFAIEEQKCNSLVYKEEIT